MNSAGNKVVVSVIVPVYNNLEFLETCLHALQNQTYPKESYEVIVVDNASEEKIENVTIQFPQVTLAHESKPGSYAARNKGIALAKGEVIAFTDSDCIPAEDWIEKGLESLFKTPNVGLVGGKIELIFKTSDKPTAIEFYDFINNHLNQAQHVSQSHFAATANVFTLASILEKVGVFNSELKSLGDMEWGRRVYSQGYQLVYSEEVCVRHPARSSLKELYKRTTRVAGGFYGLDLCDRTKGEQELAKEIFKRLKPPVKYLRWRLSDERLEGVQQKLLFAAVVIFNDYVMAFELIRLRMGGQAKRG